jgi:hypothetical protein
MKRIVILIVLVVLAGVAGVVVRSASDGTVSQLRGLVAPVYAGDVRQNIRQNYQLAPGARIELTGLNGAVKIETSDTKTAEVYIERSAPTQEALDRRKVTVEADANSLRIRGEKGDGSLWCRLFGGPSAAERVTLKLPRQISLYTKGVNGSFVTSEIDGAVDITGVNGRVQIASALGRASFKGINGNMFVGLKRIEDGVDLNGVNGNIELQLGEDVNADLDARGMNGRILSDLPNVSIDKTRRGSYWARIGNGGSGITVKGLNGNIRLTRSPQAATSETATN